MLARLRIHQRQMKPGRVLKRRHAARRDGARTHHRHIAAEHVQQCGQPCKGSGRKRDRVEGATPAAEARRPQHSPAPCFDSDKQNEEQRREYRQKQRRQQKFERPPGAGKKLDPDEPAVALHQMIDAPAANGPRREASFELLDDALPFGRHQ
jgi:hypothetical protein